MARYLMYPKCIRCSTEAPVESKGGCIRTKSHALHVLGNASRTTIDACANDGDMYHNKGRRQLVYHTFVIITTIAIRSQ